MRAQYKNNSYRRKDKTPIEIEGILPMEDFNVREIDNSLVFFLKKLRRAKVTLRNYDEFDGTVKIETGGSGALYCKLLNGICKYYKTGDVFEGKYQEIYYGPDGIHVMGIHDSGHVVLLGKLRDELVYENGRMGIQP